MKKVLVLGGTGAMGLPLVDFFRRDSEYEVFVTSRYEHNSLDNIHYLKGNARDEGFIKEVLSNKYDVIVDFMNYGYQEFKDCHTRLLKSTDYYVFLSSSRVYADSKEAIEEDFPRLLEVSNDEDFLATQRYALRKARQEDMLINSGFSNYTIVRPYITYNSNRLQFGVYEKEHWLRRLLNGKPVIITKDVIDKTTTLTYGKDVSKGIYNLIKKNSPNGEIVHITTDEGISWKKVMDIYSKVIKEKTGKNPQIYVSNEIRAIEELWEGGYNTRYDRVYSRRFNNSKANQLCGQIDYVSCVEGLENCLKDFIDEWQQLGDKAFLDNCWEYEAYSDIIFDCIDSNNDNEKYREIINNKSYEYLKKIEKERIV